MGVAARLAASVVSSVDAEHQANRVRSRISCSTEQHALVTASHHQHGPDCSCRFSFGKSPPKLYNFKTFKDDEKTDDSNLFLECDVSWHSDVVCSCSIGATSTSPIPAAYFHQSLHSDASHRLFASISTFMQACTVQCLEHAYDLLPAPCCNGQGLHVSGKCLKLTPTTVCRMSTCASSQSQSS